MMRRIVLVFATVLTAGFVAACGGPEPTDAPTPAEAPTAAATPTPQPAWLVDWNQTLEAAKSEGEVIVWGGGGGDAARQHLVTSFEKEYPGIKVTFFQPSRSSERDSRYLQERDAGVAKVDIFVGGSAGVNARVKPAGGLQPLSPFLILPEVTDLKNWENNEWIWVDDEQTFMMMGAASVAPAAAVHESVSEGELQSWWDLVNNPKFKGKIIMQDPRESGAGFARGLFWFYAPHHSKDPILGPEFTKRLYSEAGIVFSADTRENLEQVASGRMLVNISPNIVEWQALKEIGRAPRIVENLRTNGPGSEANQFSDSAGILFIPSTPLPNPNAAKVYANWFHSQAGHQALIDTQLQPSRRTDVDKSKIPSFSKTRPGVAYMNLNHHTESAIVKRMRDDVNKWYQK